MQGLAHDFTLDLEASAIVFRMSKMAGVSPAYLLSSLVKEVTKNMDFDQMEVETLKVRVSQ